MAYLAFRGRHVVEKIVPVCVRTGGFYRLLEVRNHSHEACLAALAGFAIENQVLNFLWQLLQGGLQIEPMRRSRQLEHVNEICRR